MFNERIGSEKGGEGVWQAQSARHMKAQFLTGSRPDSQTINLVKDIKRERCGGARD